MKKVQTFPSRDRDLNILEDLSSQNLDVETSERPISRPILNLRRNNYSATLLHAHPKKTRQKVKGEKLAIMEETEMDPSVREIEVRVRENRSERVRPIARSYGQISLSL